MVQFKSICEGDFHYDVEKLNVSLAWSRKDAIKWSDLLTFSTCLVHHSKEAEKLIEKFLGVTASFKYLVKHEPFVRAYLGEYHNGAISEYQLLAKCKYHLLKVNDDMNLIGHFS